MKKIVFLSLLLVFGVISANAQKTNVVKAKTVKTKVVAATKSKIPTVEGAGMVFENETIDYGKVAQNADGKRQFVLVNNGNQPLIITSATGSCGCTVPSAPKEPIAPGAKAVIDVKYATERVGPFTKTVTVSSNAVQGVSKVLTIKGEVIADTPAATTKS